MSNLERFRCGCECVVLLEQSVTKRPHFFRAELALVLQLYELGVSAAAVDHFRENLWNSIRISGVEGDRHPAAFIGRTTSLYHVRIRLFFGASEAVGAAESI